MNILNRYPWLKRWETLLFVVLIVVVIVNSRLSSAYFDIDNQANIFRLSIEKAIVVVVMAFIIINGEIDLSVASMMGFAACILAYTYDAGWAVPFGIGLAVLAGAFFGALNGFFVAYLGIPSLVLTLAGLIAYRGAARILLEDGSVGDFPGWFTDMAQEGLIGPFPFTIFMFIVAMIIGFVILQYTAFGRYVYAIGNNRESAEYAGINVRRVKMQLFIASGAISALAGVMYAARLGNVRANAAEGFELDIITIVLLGGVSIFGGRGTMLGVGLSLLLVLNIRNGMSLRFTESQIQTSVVGALLIFSVLIPNWAQAIQQRWFQRPVDETVKTIGDKGG